MTIAFPIWRERISPLLDAATRLLVITFRRGADTSQREVLLGPLTPESLARSVAELQVDVLLCGALSEPLRRELVKRHIRVRPHLCGEVREVLRAFCAGRLQQGRFQMPGCHCMHGCQSCRPAERRIRRAKAKQRATKPGLKIPRTP